MLEFKQEFEDFPLAVCTSREKFFSHTCYSSLWLRIYELIWLPWPRVIFWAGTTMSAEKPRMRVSVSCVSPKVLLLARPEKHERCEVRRSESQSERQRRCQSSIKAKEEKKGGQLLGSDGWSSSRLVLCMPQLNQVPATVPTREGVRH